MSESTSSRSTRQACDASNSPCSWYASLISIKARHTRGVNDDDDDDDDDDEEDDEEEDDDEEDEEDEEGLTIDRVSTRPE